MRLTRIAVLLFAVVALSALAAEPKPAPDPEKARQECVVEADAKLAKTPLKHPGDVDKVKRDAFDRCMAKKGVHTRVIRAK